MYRRLVTISLTFTVLGYLTVACSSSQPADNSSQSAETSVVATTEDSTADSSSAVDTFKVYKFSSTDQNGDVSIGEVDTAKSGTLAQIEPWRDQPATDGPCTIDPERDILVPYTVGIENGNASLSLPSGSSIALALRFDKSANSWLQSSSVDNEAFYSSGSTCTTGVANVAAGLQGFDFVNIKTVESLQPSQDVYTAGYLIFHNVISPNFPAGDPNVIGKAFLEPQAGSAGNPSFPVVKTTEGPWSQFTLDGNSRDMIPIFFD